MKSAEKSTEKSRPPLYRSQSLQFVPSSMSIMNPDVKELTKAIAIILQSQVQEDTNRFKTIPTKSPHYIFCEDKYTPKKENMTAEQIAALQELPSVEDIQEFIYNFYECGQFSAECCIISLIYVNRIIALSELPFTNTTWRPVMVCSLLIAQKVNYPSLDKRFTHPFSMMTQVMDDNYLNNADFAFIYPFFEIEDLNKLEKKFLELIQYNVSVKLPLYLRYYYDLRSLLYETDIDVPLPEDKEGETQLNEKLDNISKNFKEHFPEKKVTTSQLSEPLSSLKITKSMDVMGGY